MKRETSKARIASWGLQIVVAAILGQTLFFKFTGAEETKALFAVLDAEPVGRFATGIAELVAVVLLLVPRTVVFGAGLALGVILPAIFLHLTQLGISIDPAVLRDPRLEPLAGPSLFVLAVVVAVGSAGILLLRRDELPFIGEATASTPER